MNADYTNPENAEIPHPERVYLGSGEVRLACSKKKTVITLVITALIFVTLLGIGFRFLKLYFGGWDNGVDAFMFCIAGISVVCGLILNILRSGEKYHWEATGREFTISRKNVGAEIIFYKEVIMVEYEDLKFLKFFPHGYIVTVRTSRDTRVFKYVFPRIGHSLPFADTPFGKLDMIVRDLQSAPLDEAMRFGAVPAFDNPSIEDAFRDIIGSEVAKQRDEERSRSGFTDLF